MQVALQAAAARDADARGPRGCRPGVLSESRVHPRQRHLADGHGPHVLRQRGSRRPNRRTRAQVRTVLYGF